MTMSDYFSLGEYSFNISNGSIYEDDWFSGITYNLIHATYDIFLNKAGFCRILIVYTNPEPANYSYQDLPLNDGTIKLLPQSIQWTKTEKMNVRK